MAEVLVAVEHVDGELKKVSLELLTAARALGEPSAVVFGETGTAAALTDASRRPARRRSTSPRATRSRTTSSPRGRCPGRSC